MSSFTHFMLVNRATTVRYIFKPSKNRTNAIVSKIYGNGYSLAETSIRDKFGNLLFHMKHDVEVPIQHAREFWKILVNNYGFSHTIDP